MTQPRKAFNNRKRLKAATSAFHSFSKLSVANEAGASKVPHFLERITKANNIRIYEFKDGTIQCVGNNTFTLSSNMEGNDAVVLADAVLRILGLTEPVLELIRVYHIEPLAKKATDSYRDLATNLVVD